MSGPRLVLYRSAEGFGISTQCVKPGELREALARIFAAMVATDPTPLGLRKQLEGWLEAYADLVCVMRGHTSGGVVDALVHSQGTLLRAGVCQQRVGAVEQGGAITWDKLKSSPRTKRAEGPSA